MNKKMFDKFMEWFMNSQYNYKTWSLKDMKLPGERKWKATKIISNSNKVFLMTITFEEFKRWE